MKAELIGERSAGLTAVEIYDGDRLVWSNTWFGDGCTNSGYIEGLCNVYDVMIGCAQVADFEGEGDKDEDGCPIPANVGELTGVMASYDTASGWELGDDARNLGHQSTELVDALMLAGLLPADEEHDDNKDNDVVAAIVKYIGK